MPIIVSFNQLKVYKEPGEKKMILRLTEGKKEGKKTIFPPFEQRIPPFSLLIAINKIKLGR